MCVGAGRDAGEADAGADAGRLAGGRGVRRKKGPPMVCPCCKRTDRACPWCHDGAARPHVTDRHHVSKCRGGYRVVKKPIGDDL